MIISLGSLMRRRRYLFLMFMLIASIKEVKAQSGIDENSNEDTSQEPPETENQNNLPPPSTAEPPASREEPSQEPPVSGEDLIDIFFEKYENNILRCSVYSESGYILEELSKTISFSDSEEFEFTNINHVVFNVNEEEIEVKFGEGCLIPLFFIYNPSNIDDAVIILDEGKAIEFYFAKLGDK